MSRRLPVKYGLKRVEILRIPSLRVRSDKCIQNEPIWVNLKSNISKFYVQGGRGNI